MLANQPVTLLLPNKKEIALDAPWQWGAEILEAEMIIRKAVATYEQND